MEVRATEYAHITYQSVSAPCARVVDSTGRVQDWKLRKHHDRKDVAREGHKHYDVFELQHRC